MDAERLLTDKLRDVRRMHQEIIRLHKEREIIAAKKQEAERAYIIAEEQRTRMRRHFEDLQTQKEAEAQFSSNLRRNIRERTFELGQKVIMLSTKPREDLNRDVADNYVFDEEKKLSDLTYEFEATQRKYMQALKELELRQVSKAKIGAKGGRANNVDNAGRQLNMFVGDAERDVKQMKRELQTVKDKLQDLEKRIRVQESKQRELASSKAQTERRLKTVQENLSDLETKSHATNVASLAKKESSLRQQTQEKQHELDQLMVKAKTTANMDNIIDQAVRKALQQERRNITLLQKVAPGLYKVKNKPLLVMVDVDAATQQECTVTY